MTTLDKNLYRNYLVDLLSKFIEICDQHKLKYYCIGGTLLGAVRHNGLIPWDDDIDVAMPREDYDQFCNLIVNNKPEGYEFISMHVNRNYNLPFCKFYNKNTTLWESRDIPCVIGIYLDIFPLDYAPIETKALRKKFQKFAIARNQLHLSSKLRNDNYKGAVIALKNFKLRTFLYEMFFFLWKESGRNTIVMIIDRIMKGYNVRNEKLGLYGGSWGLKEFWNYEWFDEFIITKFEGLDVRIPILYHEILKQAYGNYMELPPLEKRISHHSYFFIDLHKHYKREEILAKQLN